jgi:hypothetical protein
MRGSVGLKSRRFTSRSSFRAECPAPSHLREAPGHAVEESLFDVTPVVISLALTKEDGKHVFAACASFIAPPSAILISLRFDEEPLLMPIRYDWTR